MKKSLDAEQGSTNESRATFGYHRVLACARQRVFDAFSRPELLARWWGPSGFTNTFEVFEFARGFSQRFAGTLSEDGSSIVGRWQVCRDDVHWDDDVAIAYRRSEHA